MWTSGLLTLVSRILLLEPNVKRHIYIDVVVVTNYVIFANDVMFPYINSDVSLYAVITARMCS